MYKNLAATVVAACCFFPALSQPVSQPVAAPAPVKEPLKIGFVYVAPLTDAGWVHQHDEGRKAIEQAAATELTVLTVPSVSELQDGSARIERVR